MASSDAIVLRLFLPEWCSLIEKCCRLRAVLVLALLLCGSASGTSVKNQLASDHVTNGRGSSARVHLHKTTKASLGSEMSKSPSSTTPSFVRPEADKRWKSNPPAQTEHFLNVSDAGNKQENGKSRLEALLSQHYEPWSAWRRCNRKCFQSRVRRCRQPGSCGQPVLRDSRPCKRMRRRSGACSDVSVKFGVSSFRRRRVYIEHALYDALYSDWSPWGPCTRSCRQRRRRNCVVRDVCSNSFIQEMRRCRVSGSKCPHRSLLPPYGPLSSFQGSDIGHDSMTSSTERSSYADPPAREREHEHPANPSKEKERSGLQAAAELHSVQAVCGHRPAGTSRSYRVVGGQEALRLSWPWQVAILTRWDEQYCAGTLIAPQWVLTAAHCVRKRGRQRKIVLRVGEHNLEEFEHTEDDIRPNRADVFPHPDFDYTNITNDIALVRLHRPVKLESQVGFACLPDPDFAPDAKSLCYILGWGKTRSTHVFGADSLHEAEVPLVSRKRCQRVFEYEITETQLCAGSQRGGTDSCAGDSGGPLLCPKTNLATGATRWFLTGVTSYGEGCGKRGKYGIYTRVQSYWDWIHETIESNRQSWL